MGETEGRGVTLEGLVNMAVGDFAHGQRGVDEGAWVDRCLGIGVGFSSLDGNGVDCYMSWEG